MLETIFKIKEKYSDINFYYSWLCNEKDLLEEGLTPKFNGPGLYLDSSWCVLKVVPWKQESTINSPKYSFVALYLVSYKMTLQKNDYVHPYTEDTNYTRQINADMLGLL